MTYITAYNDKEGKPSPFIKGCGHILPCVPCHRARPATATPAILPRATCPFLLSGPLNALLSKSPKAEDPQARKDSAVCFIQGSKMHSWLGRVTPLKGNTCVKDICLYWAFWPQKMQKLQHASRGARDSMNPQGHHCKFKLESKERITDHSVMPR